MAQPNPQWRDFDAAREVLVIFQRPHSYISSSWYAADPTNVLTWNDAAVHAHGSPRLLTDDDACHAFLDTLRLIMPGGRIRHSVYFSITHDEWPRVKVPLEGLLDAYPATPVTLPPSPDEEENG
jgi:hypothetical protein